MGDLVEEAVESVAKKKTGMLNVAVVGAACPLGREVFRCLSQWEEIALVSAIDTCEVGKNMRDVVGGRAANVVIEEKVGAALDRTKCDVLLDFSRSAAALQHGVSALKRGVAPILGGIKLSAPDIRELSLASKQAEVPAMVIPYFSLGAVFLLHLCHNASRWMSDVEIVDVHPDHVLEQPSTLARDFADAVADGLNDRRVHPHGWISSELTKTWQDVPLHKMRVKGSNAEQQIIFGNAGETLTVRHDLNSPTAIIEGVKLALRSIRTATGVTVGLDKLIFS